MIATGLFISLLVLTVFAQGDIVKFNICSVTYGVAISLTVAAIAVVLLGVYKFTALRQQYYKAIKVVYTTNLATPKNFAIVLGGAVMAGLLQGLLGMGSGHMISFALLSLDFLPEVASGTSGFLVAYTTLATLVEEVGMKSLKIEIAAMFCGAVFVISLIGTFLLLRYLKKRSNISNAILLILGGLCVVSIAGVVVNVGLNIHYFGIQHLLKWRKLC